MNLKQVAVVRWVAGGLLVALIGAVVIGRISGASETAEPAARSRQSVAVQTMKVATAPIRSTLTYSGTIYSNQQVGVAPRIAGQVTQLLVGVGASVRTGEILATLDVGTLPAQVSQGQASVASAQARLALVLAGARVTDVSSARAALEAAAAKLAQLLKPSASDLAAQDSAVATAKAAADNGVSTIANTKATLLGYIYIVCSQPGPIVSGVPCNNFTLPLSQDVTDSISSVLQTGVGQIGSPTSANGTALLSANAAYVTALNSHVALRQALVAAQAKRDVLVAPTPSDVAAQQSAVEAARNTLDSKTTPYTNADIEAARAALALALASLAASQASLDQTALRAPFDGVIAQQNLEVGAWASPTSSAFLLTGLAVEVRLKVEESRVGLLSPGLDAEMTLMAFPGRTFPAKVSSVAPVGDTRGQTFDVKVVAEGTDGLLRQGMFAQVSIVTARKAAATAVPVDAIVERQGKPVVFVLKDGKASQRTVQRGITNTTTTEVVSGLTVGDEIVVVGQNIVRDGQEVRVILRS